MPRRRQPRPSADTSMDADLCSADGDGDSDGGSRTPQHPQRNAANARERARMRVLSRAFCRLKTTLPWVPADTKLSKLDTLRLATSYIAHLRAVLTDQPLGVDVGQKHPLSLTWPFTFQQTGSTTMNSNCDSGGCWTNSSRDSEDEDYHNQHISHQNQSVANGQGIIRDYAPYYQQYTDSLMHIG